MPEEEIRKLLKENLEVSRDNNRLLRKINRSRIIDSVLYGLKWFFIITVSVGGYVYLQPFLKKYNDTLSGLIKAGNQVNKYLPK